MEENSQVAQPEETKQEVVYNARPRVLARILGPLVDIFLVFLASFAAFQLVLSLPIANNYYHLKDEIITIADTTKLETEYGYKLYDDDEKYQTYESSYHTYKEEDSSSDHFNHYYVVVNKETISDEVKNAYQAALKDNGTYQSHILTYRANYYGLLMLAVGSCELILFLIVPLCNKRRATVGRFVAITSLIHKKEVQAKWWQILIRFLFILIVETALPLLYFSELAALLIICGVNLLVMFISRKSYRTLRDYISFTRIIDKNSFKPINEQ